MLAVHGDLAGAVHRLLQPLAGWDSAAAACPLDEPALKLLHRCCLKLGTPQALLQVRPVLIAYYSSLPPRLPAINPASTCRASRITQIGFHHCITRYTMSPYSRRTPRFASVLAVHFVSSIGQQQIEQGTSINDVATSHRQFS